MRLGSRIGAALCLLTLAGPAQAQFAAPFGGPGFLATPEVVSGALGAGAANSAAQQQCSTQFVGRDRPRTVCPESPPPPPPKR